MLVCIVHMFMQILYNIIFFNKRPSDLLGWVLK